MSWRGATLRHVLPALGAASVLVAGPVRATFETTHLPREAAAALLAAVLAWSLRGAARRVDRLDAAVAAFAGVSALCAALAVSPTAAWRPALLTLAAAAIALGARDRPDRLRWLAWLGGAVGLLAALGAVEALGLARWSLAGRAPSSLLGQRNTLAHVLVLGSPLLWALSAGATARGPRAAWLLLAALAAAVVVMTRSRAGWLGGATALAAFTAALALRPSRGRLAQVLLAVAAGAALGALLPAPLWPSPAPYADTLRRLLDPGGSGAARLAQWRHALGLVREAPLLGVGPGNWTIAIGGQDPSSSNRFLTPTGWRCWSSAARWGCWPSRWRWRCWCAPGGRRTWSGRRLTGCPWSPRSAPARW